MAELSNYLEDALINEVLRNVGYTPAATVYVALYTTDPTDADSGTEVSGGAYARQAVTFGVPSNGVTSNSADVTFPTATANWGTVSHFGIRDAVTVGNLLFHSPVDTAKAVNNGDTAKFVAGNLVCSLA